MFACITPNTAILKTKSVELIFVYLLKVVEYPK